MLGLAPDIDRLNRQLIAIRVLFGQPLEDYEREFVARLVDSETVTLFTGAEPVKWPVSTDTAVKRDEAAECYFFHKATHPHAKHKQELLPMTAKALGVSTSFVDKAVHGTDPARRRQMEAAARDFVEGAVEARVTPSWATTTNWLTKMSETLREEKRKRSKTKS